MCSDRCENPTPSLWVAMSVPDTNRTKRAGRLMSVRGGDRKRASHAQSDANDPSETSAAHLRLRRPMVSLIPYPPIKQNKCNGLGYDCTTPNSGPFRLSRPMRPGRTQSVGALVLEVSVRVRTTLGKRSDIRWQILIRNLDGNCYGFLTEFICADLRVAAVSKIRVDPASRMTTMRSRLICLTLAISIIPVVANAQLTIDMGKITCGQYLAMPTSQSDNFSAWMSGWFSYQSRKTYVDLVAHQKNIANVKEWCKYHPSESVMTGLQKAVVIN